MCETQKDFPMRPFFVFVFVALNSLPAILMAQTDTAEIVVTGNGQVRSEPDMAFLSLGVVREALRAKDAMADSSRAVAKVMSTLDVAGIDTRDIQTSSVSLAPLWDRSDRNATPRVVGYIASNTLSVRVRDLDVLGGLLDDVLGSGANQMNGLSFALADRGPVEDRARALAVEDAIAKADVLVKAAGLSLGPIRRISEGGASRPATAQFRQESFAADVPIAAGEVNIQASVTIVFGISE